MSYKKYKIRNFMLGLCTQASDYESMRVVVKRYTVFMRATKTRVEEIEAIQKQVSTVYLETLKSNMLLKYKFVNQVQSIATGLNAQTSHPHSLFLTWLFMGDKDNKLFKISTNDLSYCQLFAMSRKYLQVM